MPADEQFLADTYVRHQGPTTSQRVFPDAGPDRGWCVVCDHEIAPKGEPVVLLPIGSPDLEVQEKMRAGRWVSARALIIHAACAGREVPS